MAAVLCLSSCGFMSENTDPDPEERDEEYEVSASQITFPYDFSEGMRPYQNGNMHNRYVTSLVCRSMVRLERDYSVTYDLVSSIESEDNRTWYVYIGDGLSFPDGAEFTAYDLRYSLGCAMADGSYYKSSLDMVSSSQVVNSTCLKIVLYAADRNFPNLLIFPIISYQTESNPVYFPGKYDFESPDLLGATDDSLGVRHIKLVQADDWDLLVYEMRLGNYSCIYEPDPVSLGNSSIGGITGLSANRMVYLGYNSTSSLTYYADFRKAVSSAIDIDYLIAAVYGNYAGKPSGIFPEEFYENGFNAPNSLDLMSASLLLDGLGFTQYDSEGYRLTAKGNRVSVNVLVCNESQTKVSLAGALATMLRDVGIEATVSSVSYAKYLTALETYDYDIYIAEVRMDYDMDISKIITPRAYQIPEISYIDYGIVESESLYEQYVLYMSGAIPLSEFMTSFEALMPFTPVCYAQTSMIFSRELEYNIVGTNWDIFYNIADWKKEQ